MVEIKAQKDVFWKALVFTLLIFLIGVYLGYLLEAKRVDRVESDFENLITDWSDAEVLSLYYQILEEDFCVQAIQQNIEFGDKIYEDGLRLDKFEEANRLKEKLIIEKRNYNLLKIKFYINSKLIKEKCNANYDYVFYFYLDDPSLDIDSKQTIMSNVLLDLKYELGDKIILLPLAADLDNSVINIMLDKYGIKEYPSVVIKEKVILEGVHTKEELLTFFK